MESILIHFRQLNCPEFYDMCVKYFTVPINSNNTTKQGNTESNPAELLINDIFQIILMNKHEVNPSTPTSAQIDYLKIAFLQDMKNPPDFFTVFNRAYNIDNYPIFKTALLAQMAINNKLTIDSSKTRQQATQPYQFLQKKFQSNSLNSNFLAKYLLTKNIPIYIFKALISLTLILVNYKEKIFKDEEINSLQKANFAALFYLLKYFDIYINNEDIQQYTTNISASESSNKKNTNIISNEKIDIGDFFIILSTFLSFFTDNFLSFLILKEKNSEYFTFFTSILTTVVQMMPKFALANNWDFYMTPISLYFTYFSSKQITFQKYDILSQMYIEMCIQLRNTLNESIPDAVQTKILLLLTSVINNFGNEKNLIDVDDKLKICFESLSLFSKIPIMERDEQNTTLFSTCLINFINTISAKYQTETDFENIKLEVDNVKLASVYHDSHDAIINSEKPEKLQYMNPKDYFESTSLIHFFTTQEAHPNPIVQDFVKSLKNFFTESNYDSDFILKILISNYEAITPSSLHIILSALYGKNIKISDLVVDFITHLLKIDIYKVEVTEWNRSQIQLNDSIMLFIFGVISKSKGIIPILNAISHLGFHVLKYLLPMFRSLMMIDEGIEFSKSFCQSHILDMIRFNITQNIMTNEKTHQIMNEIVGFLQVAASSNPRATLSALSFAQLLKDFLKIDEYVDIILPCFKIGILTTDQKCVINILNQIALIVIQASSDSNYVPTANRLILLLSETIDSLAQKSLKEYEDNHIFDLISKFPSSSKNRESLVNSLKFFLKTCLKYNGYIQTFADLLVYQNLTEAFSSIKLDSEIYILLLSMTMNTDTDLAQNENNTIKNLFALKLLLNVIKDSDEEPNLLKYLLKICSFDNSNIYQCYQSGIISYLLKRVDIPEIQDDVLQLFKMVCSKFCSQMILNKIHYTMISSNCKLKFMNIILQMMRDDSAFPVSSFFAFSGIRTGIYGPFLDLPYLTSEWSFSTSVNIEKAPFTLLNLSEGSSSFLFNINNEFMIEAIRSEKKELFHGRFKTKLESKKWTFLTFTITQREVSLYIDFENKETFPILEKFSYISPAVIKIADGFAGEIGKTYFFSTIDINKIKTEVLSSEIIKKDTICSYDPRGAYMGEIIDAGTDNVCHLVGTAVPFTTSYRDSIQNEGTYQLFMTYFSLIDSEEFFILSIQALTELIGISDENAMNFEKIGGFRIFVGLLSLIDKKYFTIEISKQLLLLFQSLNDEMQIRMFSSYWMNLTFISTLNYDYQIHFYKEEFYNAYSEYKGKITLEFTEALLYEIDKNFINNPQVDENIINVRTLQLALLTKVINDTPKSIYRKLFQFQYLMFHNNLEIDIQKEIFKMLINNASSLVSSNNNNNNNNNNNDNKTQNQIDLINFISPFFLSDDHEIRLLALKLIASILTASHAQQISKEFLFKAMMFITNDEAKLFSECFKIMFLYSQQQQQSDQETLNILNSDILDQSISIDSIVDLLLSKSTCDCIEMTPILLMFSIFYTKAKQPGEEEENNNKKYHVRDKVFDLMYHALPKLGRFYHDLASPLSLLIFSLNFSDNLDRFVEPFVVASFSNIQVLEYIVPIFTSFSIFSKTDVFSWKLHFFKNLMQRSIKSSLYLKEIATFAVQFMVHRYRPTEMKEHTVPKDDDEENINVKNDDNEIQEEEEDKLIVSLDDIIYNYDDVSTKKFTEKDSINFINYLANSSNSSTLDQSYIFEPCFVEDEHFLELLFYLLYLLINDKKNENNSIVEIPLSSTFNYSAQNMRKIIASLILKQNPNNDVKFQLIEEFRHEFSNNLSVGSSHSQNIISTQENPLKKNNSHPLFKSKFNFLNVFKRIHSNNSSSNEIEEANESNENITPVENEEVNDNNENILPSSTEANYISNLIKEGESLGKNLIKNLQNDWQYLLDLKPIFFTLRTDILAKIFKSFNNYIEDQQKTEPENTYGSITPYSSYFVNPDSYNTPSSLLNSQIDSTGSAIDTPTVFNYNIYSYEYLQFYSKDIFKMHKRFMKLVRRKTFMYQKYNQKLATTYVNESNEKLSDSTKKHWKISSKIDSLGRKMYFNVNRNFTNHMDASKLRDSVTNQSTENDEETEETKNKEEQVITYKRILEINRSLTKHYKKSPDLSFEVMMVTVVGKYNGTIVITDKMLIFEGTFKYDSFSSPDDDQANQKRHEKQKFVLIPLKQILFIFNRWSMHIDNSCEVFSLIRRSYFFIFPDTQTRRQFYTKINETIGKQYKTFKSSYFFRECCHICNGVCQNNVTNSEIIMKTNLTKDWQSRRISNFQYLYFLNIVSGRSFNDLSQYPIYPWVLKDYKSEKIDLNDESIYRDLSVPVAAMNEERLRESLFHYEMVEPLEKCLYRSHYSSPAFIIGYLIRMEPFTSLHVDLQSGRFDYPDRLFYSIQKTWEGVISTSNDYKELIPEFFTLPQMFVNENKLDLGKIQGSGYKIEDVILPNWSKTPHEFVEIHQRALESEYVRLHLNEWIDLIFGCYQKSFEKHSLFHVYSYHDCMKIPEVLNDPIYQQMAQHHSANFGSCPDKIFSTLSPRFVHQIPKPVSSITAATTGAASTSPTAAAAAATVVQTGPNCLATPQIIFPTTSSSASSSSASSASPNSNVQLIKNQTLDAAFADLKSIVYYGFGIVLLKSGFAFNVMKNCTQMFKLSMQIQPSYKDVIYFPLHSSFVFLQRNGGFASCVTVSQTGERLKTITHKSSTIECLCVCGSALFATGGSDCCINLWDVPNFTLMTSIPVQSGPIVAMGSDYHLECIVAIDSQNMVYLASMNPIKHMLTFPLDLPENVTKHRVIVLRTGLIAIASDSADRKKFTVTFYDLRGFLIKKLEFEGSVAKFHALYPSYGENFVVIMNSENRKIIVIDFSTFEVVSPFKGHVLNNLYWPLEDKRTILYVKNAPTKEIAVYEF